MVDCEPRSNNSHSVSLQFKDAPFICVGGTNQSGILLDPSPLWSSLKRATSRLVSPIWICIAGYTTLSTKTWRNQCVSTGDKRGGFGVERKSPFLAHCSKFHCGDLLALSEVRVLRHHICRSFQELIVPKLPSLTDVWMRAHNAK
jgi:hypothetical protein